MHLKHGLHEDILFVFQHGWGFTGQCWNNWTTKAGAVLALDRGYCGAGRPLELADLSQNVIVCHSLGLHLIVDYDLSEVELLVIVSGFDHFHGSRDTDGRFTRKHIKRMIRLMEKDPVALVKHFHRDCSFPDAPFDFETMNIDLLEADLHLLDSNRIDYAVLEKIPKIVICHGREDRIVPLKRAHDLHDNLPGSSLFIIDDAGHGLPFTHTDHLIGLISQELIR